MRKFKDYSQEKYKTASESKDSPTLNDLATAYYHTRDESVRERIVEQAGRERIVKAIGWKIAYKIERPDLLEELICDGNFGLIQAIESYDATTGFTFRTHLVGRVKGAILDGLREVDPLERLDRERLGLLRKFEKEFTLKNDKPPSKDDYQIYWTEQGLPPENFDSFYSVILNWEPIKSLNQVLFTTDSGLNREGQNSLKDQRHSTGSIVRRMELLELFEKDLQAIPQKYRLGVKVFLIEGISQEDAAKLLDVTPSRFSQIVKQYVKSSAFFKRTRAYINGDDLV